MDGRKRQVLLYKTGKSQNRNIYNTLFLTCELLHTRGRVYETVNSLYVSVYAHIRSFLAQIFREGLPFLGVCAYFIVFKTKIHVLVNSSFLLI